MVQIHTLTLSTGIYRKTHATLKSKQNAKRRQYAGAHTQEAGTWSQVKCQRVAKIFGLYPHELLRYETVKCFE